MAKRKLRATLLAKPSSILDINHVGAVGMASVAIIFLLILDGQRNRGKPNRAISKKPLKRIEAEERVAKMNA